MYKFDYEKCIYPNIIALINLCDELHIDILLTFGDGLHAK